MNEKELIDKIINKDEQAFNFFVDKYFKIFYKIIQRVLQDTSTHDEIMDCLSEAYTYIWYHIDNFHPDKYSLRNWCSLIIISRAQNHLVDIIRQENKKERLQEQLLHDAYAPSAEDVYIENKSIEYLLNKIDLLPPASGTVFKLRYIDGLKPRQIAEKLNITVKQVDNYLTYAKKKLRKAGLIDEQD